VLVAFATVIGPFGELGNAPVIQSSIFYQPELGNRTIYSDYSFWSTNVGGSEGEGNIVNEYYQPVLTSGGWSSLGTIIGGLVVGKGAYCDAYPQVALDALGNPRNRSCDMGALAYEGVNVASWMIQSTIVSYLPDSPSFSMIPTQLSGGGPINNNTSATARRDLTLSATFVGLTEVGINGVNTTTPIPQSGFTSYDNTLSAHQNLGVGYVTTLPNNATLRFTLAVWNQTTTLNFTSVPLVIRPFSCEWTIHVDNWPFADPQNLLRLDINLFSNDGTIELAPDQSYNDTLYYWTAGSTIIVSFPSFSLNDNQSQPISIQTDTSDGYLGLSFCFNSFQTELVYDPDISVLLGQQSSSNSNNQNSGGLEAWQYVVYIVVPLIFVLLVVALGVVLLSTYMSWRKKRWFMEGHHGSINFGETEERGHRENPVLVDEEF